MKNYKMKFLGAVVSASSLFVSTANALQCDFNNPNPDTTIYSGWDFKLNPLTPKVIYTNTVTFNPSSTAGLSSLNPNLRAGNTLEQYDSTTNTTVVKGFAQFNVGYKLSRGNSYSSGAAIYLPSGAIVVGGYSNSSFTIPSGIKYGYSPAKPTKVVRVRAGAVHLRDTAGTRWELLTNGDSGRIVHFICQEQNSASGDVARSCRASHLTNSYEQTYNPSIDVIGRDQTVGIRCAAYTTETVEGYDFSSPQSSWYSLMWK